MITDKFNLKSVFIGGYENIIINVRSLLLVLCSLILLLPLISTADGLFDFQMKLAERDNVEAQFKVGEMYETGFGVKKDMAEARTWVTKAADQGLEKAKFKLSYWDIEKNGLTDSNKAGLEDIKAKVKQGNSQAEYYLGKMLAHGVGMKQDNDEALIWLNKAALVGILEAEREITTVREAKQKQDYLNRVAAEKRLAKQKARKQKELQAQQERERKAQLEAQRKLEQEQEQKAKNKIRSSELEKKKLEKEKQQEIEKARLRAEQQEQADKKAEEQRLEAKKQALIIKEEKEKTRKAKFESDPCSGKSARFLSTCR